MPTVARGDVTVRPCSRTSPASGFMSPATSRVSVDLPHPDGPTTAVKPPSGTHRSSPASTGSGPSVVA